MAIKIIKQGVKEFHITCPFCYCEFTYEKEDVPKGTINCPCCGAIMDAKQYTSETIPQLQRIYYGPKTGMEYNDMEINKVWAMPNKNTFSIKPIKEFILSNLPCGGKIIDPFANICPLKEYFAEFEYVTNDLDEEMPTDYHLDALDFLKTLPDNCADMVLFDPPFSPRQVSESYKRLGKTVNMATTQASFWGNLKNEIARITKQNGIVFSFGWNSNGIGLKNGFVQKKILMVAHGGNHNDTICILETKENRNN